MHALALEKLLSNQIALPWRIQWLDANDVARARSIVCRPAENLFRHLQKDLAGTHLERRLCREQDPSLPERLSDFIQDTKLRVDASNLWVQYSEEEGKETGRNAGIYF
jgi:hypothetical protein